MSLLDHIFKKKNPERALSAYFKTLSGYTPVFTSFEGGVYEMELTRSCIHAFATHCSKLRPELIGGYRPDLAATLAQRPNPFMDTSKYLYRLASVLSVYNNAFIVPVEDMAGRLVGYYPLVPEQTELREAAGELYLRYRFANGDTAAIEFERAGVLNQFQLRDDFFGESNLALRPTLELIHAQNEGIVEGIKNAASVRFIVRLAQNLNETDKAKERKLFSASNLSADNGGVLMLDTRYGDVKQVESTAMIVNPRQQELIRDSVFSYFGTNQKILTNEFDEETWNSYYEGKVEPFAIQASLVHSGMTFSGAQLQDGAGIVFTTNRLQYASNKTKLEVVTQMFDRGFITHNQGLEIFNMAPIENGDKHYIRSEYSEVDKLHKDDQPVSESDPEPKEGE